MASTCHVSVWTLRIVPPSSSTSMSPFGRNLTAVGRCEARYEHLVLEHAGRTRRGGAEDEITRHDEVAA